MAFILPHHASKAVSLEMIVPEYLLTIRRFYNAHETTTVEEFAIALLCGDVRCDVSSSLLINNTSAKSKSDVCWSVHPRWE